MNREVLAYILAMIRFEGAKTRNTLRRIAKLPAHTVETPDFAEDLRTAREFLEDYPPNSEGL